MAWFKSVIVRHIPREHNTRANVLSKLASTIKKGENKSVIQEFLPRPNIEALSITADINLIGDATYWMTLVYNYLASELLLDDPKEVVIVRGRACSYVLVKGRLYHWGIYISLLKCVDKFKTPTSYGRYTKE